jgi:hypothetical protein
MRTTHQNNSTRVVISAESNAYMAWQAKLAHYSCLSRLGQAPLIVVHEGNGQGISDWRDINSSGGVVLSAPSYKLTRGGWNYACRNAAGTLLEAARVVGPEVHSLLLCDPDMVFVWRLRPGLNLAGAACGYMDYSEAPVRAAMRKLGVTLPRGVPVNGGSLCCGTPYLIPRECAAELALAWLEAIDAFDRPRWEDNMYAFGLAAIMLGLRLRRISMADTNYYPEAPVRASVVHYCYDNDLWSKRRFASRRAARRVWTPPAGAQPGTILAEVLRQLTEARRFYEQLGKPIASRKSL